MITEEDKHKIKWCASEAGVEPLSKRDWEMIEFALWAVGHGEERDGNRIKANRTDFEQERISLLAARKMKATGMKREAVIEVMKKAGIKWVFKNAIMSGSTIKKYVYGKPRGKTPEDYIAQDESPSAFTRFFFSIEAEIRDWEGRTGMAIASGLPDFGPPNPEG